MTDPADAPDRTTRPGPMDTVLLHDLVRWREALARSIARNNLAIRSDGIMTAVNRILFPILFLRAAEDRGLVPAGILEDIRSSHTVPVIISRLSGYADTLYAGILPEVLVHDTVPENIPEIDEPVMKKILDQITSPDRRYDLAVMSTPAVAQVLTHYLSRTVRRSAAHMAAIVDTHDTVLAGGIMNPPLPLMTYLVREAIRSARSHRSCREILPLRLFDPACGAGAPLLAAYRVLLEDAGGPALSFEERREILLHSVHGLDRNPHAVAAARMLLVLELFDGRNISASWEQFTAAARAAARDLRQNIFCGNALISPEIETDEAWTFCPPRDRHALCLFAYRESFPEIFAAGGFDLVLSNPPEGALEKHEWIQQYFQRRYAAYHPLADRSAYFVEKAISLVVPGGTVGMIMNGRWLRGDAGSPLRELLAALRIEEIADLSALPADLPGAGLTLVRFRPVLPARTVTIITGTAGFSADPGRTAPALRFPVQQDELRSGGWVLADTRAGALLAKIRNQGTFLEDVVMGQVHRGIRMDDGDPFVVDGAPAREWIRRDPRCKPLLRPVFRAGPAGTGPAGTFRILIPRGWTRARAGTGKNSWQWFRHRYPQLARHLKPHAEELRNRAGPEALWWETVGDEFWEAPRKKIFFSGIAGRPVFRFDTGRGIGDTSVCAFPSSGPALAGILNSRLIAFVLGRKSDRHPAEKISWTDLGRLPIIIPDLDRPKDRTLYERLGRTVQKQAALEQQLSGAKTDAECGILEKKIRAAGAAADTTVYELYGLTPDEIVVAEGIPPS